MALDRQWRAGAAPLAVSSSPVPSTRRTRKVLIGIAVAVSIVAVLLAWRGIRQHFRYGTVIGEGSTAFIVDSGDRFSLKVPDRGASVGDSWRWLAQPEGIVVPVRDELVSDGLRDRLFEPALGGGGGSRYFTFEAEQPGRARIALINCFQGCWDEDTKAESRTIVWTVTVSDPK